MNKTEKEIKAIIVDFENPDSDDLLRLIKQEVGY